ncbi:MAG: response regulator [Verrucomicrobia bacterium]|nr:response regulator [Verrucomicrobiota bacterium]
MSIPCRPLVPTASAKTILIVDDDVHLAASLALGLEASGYRTLHAANATAGWEMAHAHRPDLILSDIDMPGKDGCRLLQEMRADPELAGQQFVLMTGKAAYGSSRTAMDLGADDFLLKPFSLGELLQCVGARLKRAELSRRMDEGAIERMRESLRSTLPHEFFTPLASILGLSELCRTDLERLTPDEIRQDLSDINEAGRRLHRALRNYLRLLELESQGSARSPPLVEGGEVAEAIESGVQAAAERHRRTGDVAREVEGARLRASPGDLATLVEELVDNALTYSRRNTAVEVRARREGPVLRLVVSDSGRGISPQQLKNIDDTWQRPGEGSRLQGMGLGLMLAYRLVRTMGGELRLESQGGEGTTAEVTLPVA